MRLNGIIFMVIGFLLLMCAGTFKTHDGIQKAMWGVLFHRIVKYAGIVCMEMGLIWLCMI